jgi:hypothetical protein
MWRNQYNDIFLDAHVLPLRKDRQSENCFFSGADIFQLTDSYAAWKLATLHWRHLLSLPGAACEDIVYLSARA